jgi:hypothetical protein
MNAWFFGCSFTAGYGLNFEEWYQESNANFKGDYNTIKDEIWEYPHIKQFSLYKDTYSDSIWPKLISAEYGLIYNNLAESGAGNDRIIHKVINSLHKIKPGDYVFLGTSEPCRILLPSGLDDPSLMSTLIFINKLNENKIGEGGISFHNYDQKQKNIIIDFLYEIVHQNPEAYNNYYKKVYLDLQKFFQSIGVTCVIWEWPSWFNYETIKVWSDKKINDGHWSPNGHYQFYLYMKKNLDNCNYNVSSLNKHMMSPFKKKTII